MRGFYCAVFGGIVFHESYYGPEDRDAALLYVADHMIEVMSPRHTDDFSFMFARFLQKSGPSYHSISFHVPDAERSAGGVRRTGDPDQHQGTGPALSASQESTGGIIMELTDHKMPNDPDLPNWRADWAAGRTEPAAQAGSDHLRPRNPAAATAFLVDKLGGNAGAPFTVDWPQRASATPVDVADGRLLILDPADRGAGPLVQFAAGPTRGFMRWPGGSPTARPVRPGLRRMSSR